MPTTFAVLIPYRNDRPRFMANLQRMLKGQTVQPDAVLIMDYVPRSEEKDITQRYREGYDIISKSLTGVDLIFLIEVDDWYAPDYFETMLSEWGRAGRPDLLGLTYTIYYHIKLFAWYNHEHCQRSSAMNTAIRPGLALSWCADSEPYTDMHLWALPGLRKHLWTPDRHICLGIKHGEGMVGGQLHNDRLGKYLYPPSGNVDADKKFLRENMDAESFEFYSNYFSGQE